MAKEYVINESITGDDLRRLRQLLGMTQKEFADFVGVSKRTVERWEYSDDQITGPICLVADLLIKNHEFLFT